jgi:argininosuccinate lyase
MEKMAASGYTLATDVAEYLVSKGMGFRQAHRAVGKMVRYCLEEGKELEEMTIQEFKGYASVISEDIYEILDLKHSVDSRNSVGGTSLQQVRDAISRAEEELSS